MLIDSKSNRTFIYVQKKGILTWGSLVRYTYSGIPKGVNRFFYPHVIWEPHKQRESNDDMPLTLMDIDDLETSLYPHEQRGFNGDMPLTLMDIDDFDACLLKRNG